MLTAVPQAEKGVVPAAAAVEYIPSWGVLWLVVSSAACTPDFLYVLLSPKTLPGGEYGDMLPFTLWHIYASLDRRYSNPEDTFNYVQSVLNVLEIAAGMSIAAFASRSSRGAAKALAALSTCTAYKTVIYFLMEIASGFEYTKHNHWSIVALVAALSLPWIAIPSLLAKQVLDKLG